MIRMQRGRFFRKIWYIEEREEESRAEQERIIITAIN